jgi:hypothetical protein
VQAVEKIERQRNPDQPGQKRQVQFGAHDFTASLVSRQSLFDPD